MTKCYLFIPALLLSVALSAQTPTDLQFLSSGDVCAGVGFGYDAWSKYWEGDVQRENGNVGTVSRQQFSAGLMLGIVNRLNFHIRVPYVATHASQGTLNGQSGLQDLNLNLKGKFAEIRLGKGNLVLGGNLGFSTPLSKYLVDFAPLNLGFGTTNLSYRQMAAYQTDMGLYFGARANYTYRSNVPNIHRDFYYDQGNAYYLNEINVDDVLDWTLAAGYTDAHILAEIDFNAVNTLGGSDIRTWDPGFPSNDMDAATLTGRFDYYFSKSKGLNFSVTGGYTLSGRNVGQSVFGNVGINYLFSLWGKGGAVQ